MYYRTLLLLVCFGIGALASRASHAQIQIDSTLVTDQGIPINFSRIIPSSYDPNEPSGLILSFHPWHAEWGSGKAWCDILSAFAESNNMLMICPDGGPDGRIDGTLDLDFALALIDSSQQWYTIDPDQVFGLGFSWGGRSMYVVGLDNPDRFAGFLIMGAFIDGLEPVGNTRILNAENKPFYIIHGATDQVVNLDTGFYPIVAALQEAGAVVATSVLDGVDHTIHFTDRDLLLTDALTWLVSMSMNQSLSTIPAHASPVDLAPVQAYPNPFMDHVTLAWESNETGTLHVQVFDVLGRTVRTFTTHAGPGASVVWDGRTEAGQDVATGVYMVRIQQKDRVIGQTMLYHIHQ